MYDKQNGIVASRMNLTLINVKSASGSPQSPPNPENIKSLVYEYDPASPQDDNRGSSRHQNQQQNTPFHESSSSSSSSSSSDSSSSESQKNNVQPPNRSRRSAINPSHFGDNQYRVLGGNIRNNDNALSSSSSPNSDSSNKKNKILSNIRKQDSSSSSSSSDSDSSVSSSFEWESEEEDNWQQNPSLSEPPKVPFMPWFIANQGNSVQSSKDLRVVSVVKKIAQQIGVEVQTPTAIPGQKTLYKFTIIAGLVRTMSAKQIEDASKELYYPLSRALSSSPSDAEKYQAW